MDGSEGIEGKNALGLKIPYLDRVCIGWELAVVGGTLSLTMEIVEEGRCGTDGGGETKDGVANESEEEEDTGMTDGITDEDESVE